MDTIREVSNNLKQLGGKCYLVGGSVIDFIKNRKITEYDVEVFGLSPSVIRDEVSKFGDVSTVGKTFGVVKLNNVMDFSVPRRENRIGAGHVDFDVDFDPHMSIKDAALRRNFTINSIYLDIDTLEIHDYYNGIKDLNDGILRHVSDKFGEDPLRVLIAMQLLSRKVKTVAPETLELCMSLKTQFNTISKERIYAEFNKLLLKGDNPGMGMQFLKDSGWIECFPELNVLIACKQKECWHPEGVVYSHVIQAVDNAAKVRHICPDDWMQAFMYGVLLHDVGKPLTTDENLRSHGHAEAGVDVAETFMRRLCDDADLIGKVKKIVKHHMTPWNLTDQHARICRWKRLHNEIRLDVIGLVARCDDAARNRNVMDPDPVHIICQELTLQFGDKPIAPVLMGRHLIAMGMTPGPSFKKLLKEGYDYQIETGETNPSVILSQLCANMTEKIMEGV
jgi:tRNA nucleotidyltransferase (CCA-adding enzyme)